MVLSNANIFLNLFTCFIDTILTTSFDLTRRRNNENEGILHIYKITLRCPFAPPPGIGYKCLRVYEGSRTSKHSSRAGQEDKSCVNE